ncbi:MAG: ABC transporter ATP-binding protein [Bacilli bacterium]|nr:ABC transporter ATP-binding protein [Bacilli bacterium]MDD3895813.1 ABC transporter ATP-binding protein [Bacilli bacterium]MDD4407850.1 ABC transporter ATP-binding protein [Bacilli bacterium]
MKAALEIKNLTKYYGDILGVKNLNLELEKGEIFGFIGPNGAGKSTTLRCIMNLINKSQGEIYINGILFDKDNTSLKEIVGYLPSEINLYEDLTVQEILNYHQSFYKKDLSKNRNKLVKLFKLDENKKIENLSLGNLKKLGIVLALMHEPEILILDEPTSGLDPIMQQTFYNLLLEEKKKGTTILYSTHVLNEVAKICDRVGIIKEGNLLKIESIENLHKLNLFYVTIISEEVNKIIKELKLNKYEINNNLIKFRNTIDINILIKALSKFKINKLLIEEASLEDIFLHYYK